MWTDARVAQFRTRRIDPAFRDVDAWERCVIAAWMDGRLTRTVMDVGCGDGRLFDLWHKYAGSVIGIDGNAGQCRAAKQRAASLGLHCQILQRDFTHDTLPPADLAVCARIWAHLDEQAADRLLDRLTQKTSRAILHINERNDSAEAAAIEAGGLHRLDSLPRIEVVLAALGWRIADVRRLAPWSTALFIYGDRATAREDNS